MEKQLRTGLTALFCVALIGLGQPAYGQAPRTRVEFGLNRTAKILCSAVFVSGRDLEEAMSNSARRVLPDADWRLLASGTADGAGAGIKLDRSAGRVEVTLRGFTGRARYYGDQGCVILPAGFDDVFFEPVELKSSLPDSMSQPWPMGDRVSDAPLPRGLDGAKVQRAVDAAFEDDALTAAFVAVYRGQIIGERYGQGAGKDTQLESWSMGKSLTATLVGVLAQQGHVSLDDPAPVALWHEDPEDPRSKITIRDLMRMSSGLLFTHASQPAYEWGRSIADHNYVYANGIDVFNLSITRPVEFPPNTVGRYRNCDPLTLGYIIRQTVERLG